MNPKLLIVDDERGIVDMIQSYFQAQYDILTAYSGQEALKFYPINAIRFIIEHIAFPYKAQNMNYKV